MKIKTLLVLAITSIVIVFSFQNLQSVNLRFLLWEFNASLSLYLLLSVLLGIIIGMLIAVMFRKSAKNRVKQKTEDTVSK